MLNNETVTTNQVVRDSLEQDLADFTHLDLQMTDKSHSTIGSAYILA